MPVLLCQGFAQLGVKAQLFEGPDLGIGGP